MNDHTPDKTCQIRQRFGLDTDLEVPCFSAPGEHVPDVDPDYVLDASTTLSILAGFAHNRRVLLQGNHGTGKSTHIEQVAARLNWPCIRVNLDGHITRMDLIGKDGIVIENQKQVTRFQPGILTWALEHPVALIFDEYDAGRPDVMFVIQRVLETDGKLTLLDQNRVITPHPAFRLFATANTIGLGDATGLYHGTQPLNQGQLDRWHIIAVLNYLPPDQEKAVLLAKCPELNTPDGREQAESMVLLANLIRKGFVQGDLSTVMSPRTLIAWAENMRIFKNRALAFSLTFYNRCDDTEQPLIAEYYQRCFAEELPRSGKSPALFSS
ncbi:AAA family ATPase [Desulfobacter latus]|uniref:AAA family ATPase n=1 Tax=Desulfobacter latus TaxID=2292 RepID=A0A850T7Q4_9BACT|nr:AAA family ATPase [Desulfobacter latus]NWH03396.1 AAA family ATPase [Desulfobacter latus]